MRKIPACAGCHDEPDRNPLYPPLHGQSASYLALQLDLFRQGHRGGTRYAGLMRAAAEYLEPRDVADLAAHYACGSGVPDG